MALLLLARYLPPCCRFCKKLKAITAPHFRLYFFKAMQTAARIARSRNYRAIYNHTVRLECSRCSSYCALHNSSTHLPGPPTCSLAPRSLTSRTELSAVCIYSHGAFLSLNLQAQLSANLENLVSEVISHMSHIRPRDALFTATTWPVFKVGAGTSDKIQAGGAEIPRTLGGRALGIGQGRAGSAERDFG